MKNAACRAAVLAALALAGGSAPARADLLSEARAAFQSGRQAEAVKLLTQAAEKGDARAQFRLGLLYERGRGVPKNEKKAAEWYAKAAAGGSPEAANNLGTLCRLGRGVARSDAEAFKWYLKAAAMRPDGNQAGDTDAKHDEAAVWTNLGGMYHWGRGTARDDVKALGV